MSVERNLKLLQLPLPQSPRPMGVYVPAVGAEDFLFVSGMLPMEDRAPAFVGRIGQELTIASGQRAAELAVGNALESQA